ncbi:hypothetical protein B0J11DRAFT_544482 [Dendryphion nanum]|uniref:Uncharacterized protein n=1 Tax=Dendryphion nanum TaxID=256645 RepID=A0A9P9CZ30_9PLEO|nr:hypothetical protein B0J11DRAFT_544482 [Dendryphion nanum]
MLVFFFSPCANGSHCHLRPCSQLSKRDCSHRLTPGLLSLRLRQTFLKTPALLTRSLCSTLRPHISPSASRHWSSAWPKARVHVVLCFQLVFICRHHLATFDLGHRAAPQACSAGQSKEKVTTLGVTHAADLDLFSHRVPSFEHIDPERPYIC